MQRYFLKEPYESGVDRHYCLVNEDYHHALHVMRMELGDQCYLAFTNKRAIVGEIINITDTEVWLEEVATEAQEKELPIDVTVACGYPKGDKLEWIVQKGTELGAHHFVGFPAKTSVVKWDGKKLAKKQERLEKIAKEAAEQSHRQIQPTITLCEKNQDWLSQLTDFDHVLIAYEESAKQGEQAQLAQTLQAVKGGERVLVVFGPEGGLAPEEVAQLMAVGGKPCGLGPRILRAETAPLYLLSALSYQLELLG